MILKIKQFEDPDLDKQFRQIIDTLNNGPSWIAPTLAGTWVNNGGAYAVSGYHKNIFGYVHLKGLIKNGAAATLFTLPTGYRPLEQLVFAVQGNGAYANVEITTAGVVQVTSALPANVSLDGITFRTY